MFERFADQNFYQVLEVSYDASADEIQSAYEEAREIYGPGALVSGSILSEPERRHTFQRIAEAYQTLIAEESRRLYDKSLGLASKHRRSRASIAVPAPEVNEERAASPGAEGPDVAPEGATPSSREEASGPRRCPLQLGLSEEATGEFLQRAREAMGLDLGKISRETKIGRSMLEYIETERVERLPAPIYLRNFTRQIARCLGLDEDKVSRTYLARIRRLQSGT